MGFIILVAVVLVASLFLFIQVSTQLANVKRQRTLFWDAILKEHRYWHLCRGGLSVDENGAIAHFAQDEGEDYDAARKVRI